MAIMVRIKLSSRSRVTSASPAVTYASIRCDIASTAPFTIWCHGGLACTDGSIIETFGKSEGQASNHFFFSPSFVRTAKGSNSDPDAEMVSTVKSGIAGTFTNLLSYSSHTSPACTPAATDFPESMTLPHPTARTPSTSDPLARAIISLTLDSTGFACTPHASTHSIPAPWSDCTIWS